MISCSQPAGTELENRVPGVATISPLAAAAIATTLGGIAIVGTRFLDHRFHEAAPMSGIHLGDEAM